MAGGIFAVGLILAPGGMAPLRSQEPAHPAIREDGPKVELKPDARLRVQRIKTRKARALYEVARLNRELAEIAVDEYREETYPHELATVESELTAAERNRDRTKARSDRARRMLERWHFAEPPLVDLEDLNLEKANFMLEQVQSKRDVLVKYTRAKVIRDLEGVVKNARDAEGDKETDWKREAARLAELEREVGRK
jgi:hypothetical protein